VERMSSGSAQLRVAWVFPIRVSEVAPGWMEDTVGHPGATLVTGSGLALLSGQGAEEPKARHSHHNGAAEVYAEPLYEEFAVAG
jgi:hypothetical protein